MANESAYQEFTGKSVEEALKAACETFKVGLADLDFEIIAPGSKGVLGMGAEPARIVAAPASAIAGSTPKRATEPAPRAERAPRVERAPRAAAPRVESAPLADQAAEPRTAAPRAARASRTAVPRAESATEPAPRAERAPRAPRAPRARCTARGARAARATRAQRDDARDDCRRERDPRDADHAP